MTAQILDGKETARLLREELAGEVAQWLASGGAEPTLAAVLVGDDKERACSQVGMASRLLRRPASTTTQELLDLLASLNQDRQVNGILVQLPLPASIDTQRVLDAVHPSKDVDAFCPENVGLLVQGRPRFLPCTPHGVVTLLARYNISLAGQHVVVVGRSDIVGKPLANMLLQRDIGFGPQFANATVTVCHSQSKNLADITRSADVLVAAVGRPGLITASMVKPGAVVVDVGINRVEDRLVGDVDFGPVREVASFITPVPGGVGPLTIAMLLRNTLEACKQQNPQP